MICGKNFDPSQEWKSRIPEPVYEKHPEWLSLYWKAWELAHDHIKEIPGMPQTPYMDEAFLDSNIWIWDTCFMALFCKFSPERFPGVESFRNFYEPLHNHQKLPGIMSDRDAAMLGYPKGAPVPIQIHIADNPPLFAWAEYMNAMYSGNNEHIRRLLLENQFLQKHFCFLETMQEQQHPECVYVPTFWRKHPKGYFWEGGRSGMDNTPRGRSGKSCSKNRPNNPDMLWVDAIAQQALSALYISRLAELIGENELAVHWKEIYRELKNTVNENYWDEEDGVYYDIHAETGAFMKVVTPASFWVMLAEIPSQDQAERMCRYLIDPQKLGGKVPCLSLARDDGDFDAETGNYWRGSLWIPTAYMIIKALDLYGFYELSAELSGKIIHHMNRTYLEYSPHTIWECYAPEKPEPAFTCGTPQQPVRKDFCGWSALGPISLFIENVLGFHFADSFRKELFWTLPENPDGKIGIKNFRFGEIITDIILENGACSVETNMEFTLHINGKPYKMQTGKNEIHL